MTNNKLDLLKSRIQNHEPISEVDLSNCDLDQLPSVLFDLADTLAFLNIGGNKLSTLPENFAIFTKLRILFAPNNLFTELPSVLGKLSSLYMVSFKSNHISVIPEDSLSPSVGWLILTGNQISALPHSIGNLLPLRKLMLAGNQLTTLPISLSNCRNLELIRLACNQLTSIPEFLLQMPKLSWIALSGNPGLNTTTTATTATNVHASSSSSEPTPLREYSWNELTIGDKLGEGASGTVYKATWKLLSNDATSTAVSPEVAVKLFKGENTSDGSPEDEMRACVAAGTHASSIGVIGRLKDTPSNQLGLILELVPASFTTLGQPPSFSSVTRDCYSSDTQFDLSFVLHIVSHIAQVSCHLHARGINHGDLYAHNILVERDHVSRMKNNNTTSSSSVVTGLGQSTSAWRPPLLGDFGAASFYSADMLEGLLASARFQKCEVRAFGCLLEELLDKVTSPNPVSNPESNSIEKQESSVSSSSDGGSVGGTSGSKRARLVEGGYSMKSCIEALRVLVQECMNANVDDRPTFDTISQRLLSLLTTADCE